MYEDDDNEQLNNPPVDEPEVQQENTPEEAPAPAWESFDWLEWDGDVGSLPDEAQPWAEKINARYSSKYEEGMRDLDATRELYNRLSEGAGDPRVEEYAQKAREAQEALAAAEARMAEKSTSVSEWEQKYQELQSAYEESKRAVAERDTQRFVSENEWIFDDGPNEELASELMDEGFHPNYLPDVMRLEPGRIAKLREEAKNNPSGLETAIRYEKEMATSTVSSAKDLVGGAVASPTSEPVPPPRDIRDMSKEEQTRAVIRKQMRKQAGNLRR